MKHRYYSQVDQIGERADMHLFIQNFTNVLSLTRKLDLARSAATGDPHHVWGRDLDTAIKAGRETA